jgi:hypothetical protein
MALDGDVADNVALQAIIAALDRGVLRETRRGDRLGQAV